MTMSNGLYYALYFVGIVITHYFIITMINVIDITNGKKRKLIISFLLLNFINFFLEISNVFILKNIFVILNIIIFIKINSHINIKSIIISFLRIFMIILLVELLIGIFLHYFGFSNYKSKYYVLLIKMIGLFITYMLYISYLIYKSKIKNIEYKIDTSGVFLLMVILLLVVIGCLNFMGALNGNLVFYPLFILLLLFIVMGIRLIMKLIKRNYKNNVDIKYLKKKNSEVMEYVDEFKTYKHNLRYDLLAIKEFGNKKVNKEIDLLLNKNDDELNYINNFKEIPSSLIHIFSDRLSITNNNNINVIIRNSLIDKELVIREKDYLKVCEIIGNCLTNAIEALPIMNGLIYINFYELHGYQVISIVNNFDNSIDFEKIGTKYYSTKNRGSGYGLSSVFNNNKIKVEAKVINNLFNFNVYLLK